MKKFIRNLMKFVCAVSSILAVAAAMYYFIKKYVRIEQKTAEPDTDTPSRKAADDEEEKPAVNRKYVNIVLDWDQAKEDASDLAGDLINAAKGSQAQESEAASTDEKTASAESASEAASEPAVPDTESQSEASAESMPSGETPTEEESAAEDTQDKEPSADSSIHLTD